MHVLFDNSTLQVKVFAWSPFGNQLFWFRETFFTNQVTSSEILGAMATKMVATWKAVIAGTFFESVTQAT